MASKSDSIQFKYREVSLDPTIMVSFADADGLYSTDYQKTDELLDLTDELQACIRKIISENLTPRQKEVLELIYFEGLTQTEAALKLGLCQPTIHKTTHGNIDYRNGGKRYGGALKKIRKLCDEDSRITSILKRISEIKTEHK